MDAESRRLTGFGGRMSVLTRYGFAAVVGLYGVYHLTQSNLVTGLLGLAAALLLVLVAGRR